MQWRRLLAAGSVCAVTLPLLNERRRENAAQLGEGVVRFSRAAFHGGLIVYDYKRRVQPVEEKHGKASSEYAAVRAEVDKRSAERLLHVCQLHGGIYIKLGQYLSTMNNVLPKEYTSTLAAVQDKARSRPFAEMERVVREELGSDSGDLFSEIESMPVAAASLAQVHRAVTREGQEVAVKIQYPGLRQQIAGDLLTIKLFTRIVGHLFPDYSFTWMIPDFESSLRNEVNFLQEAQNAERVSAMFCSNPHVHIPAIVRNLSSERVLTMEYIHGVKVNDMPQLRSMGIDPKDVAMVMSTVFSEMIHVHGFVHCDPHPGNLMVRRTPGSPSRWQLVVLDHGMYRRLSPHFRAAYCRLWKALITQDSAMGRRATLELGLDVEAYDALSLLLTFRGADSQTAAGKRLSQSDVAKVKARYSKLTPGDINRFLQRLPREMMFITRSTNMVRSLNAELGGSSRQRFKITGESAIRGLILTDSIAEFVAQAQAFRQEGGDVRLVSTAASAASTPAPSRWWAFLTGSPPEHEQLTYLNALATGALISEPTESELQRTQGVGLWKRAALQYELLCLRLRLWMIDALLALASLSGAYVPAERRGRHQQLSNLG